MRAENEESRPDVDGSLENNAPTPDASSLNTHYPLRSGNEQDSRRDGWNADDAVNRLRGILDSDSNAFSTSTEEAASGGSVLVPKKRSVLVGGIEDENISWPRPAYFENVDLPSKTIEERKRWLAKAAKLDEALDWIKPVLGIVLPTGNSFPCVLHPGKEATIWRGKNGELAYRCLHVPENAPSRTAVLTIPEVYAGLVTKEVKKLRKSPTLIWRLRLYVHAELLDPAPIVLPNTERVRHFNDVVDLEAMYDGIRLAFQVRWLYERDEPIPFSTRFAMGWLGWPASVKNLSRSIEARKALIDAGVIRIADYLPPANPEWPPTPRFLPGAMP